MIKVRIRKLKGQIPSSLDELKVKHFIAMEGKKDSFEIMSIFTGISKEDLLNTGSDLTPLMNRIIDLQHSFAEPPKDRKPVVLEGVKLTFPKSLEFTKYGQTEMVKRYALSKDFVSSIPEVFAVYAQPYIDGSFNPDRIPELADKVRELRIVEVYAWVLFFFRKLLELRTSLQSQLTTYLKLLNKPQAKPSTTFTTND